MCVRPNSVRERCSFFESICNYLKCDRRVILIGDFNCVCASEDRVSTVRYHDQSADLLREILDECELADVAQCASSPDCLPFTHFQGASHA